MFNEAKILIFDLASGREIFDEEKGRVMNAKEIDEAIRKVCFEHLGLNEKSTTRDIKRALKSEAGRELMSVIEEAVDIYINYGWKESEFFNNFVEIRNIKDGDMNEFYVEDKDIILNVEKVAGDHHDLGNNRVGIA